MNIKSNVKTAVIVVLCYIPVFFLIDSVNAWGNTIVYKIYNSESTYMEFYNIFSNKIINTSIDPLVLVTILGTLSILIGIGIISILLDENKTHQN